MLFEFSSEVTGLATYVGKGDALEFRFDSPRVITVRLSKDYADGLKPRESSDAVCTGTTGADPPDSEIEAALKAGWRLPVVEGKILDGDPTTKFIDGVFADLRSKIIETATLFRWRYGIAEGPPDPCHTSKQRYSEDGRVWHDVTLLRSIRLMWGLTVPSTAEDGASKRIVELVVAGMEEPLGRQLFREAWSQRSLRPRSALVIGVAAAEVGFKKLVGTLVPHAQWLVDEIQTPSLSKMLSKYLPTLPVKARFVGKTLRPPKVLLRQLDKAVERRNKLVHAGEPPPSLDELEEMLRAVNDFLWICDVYQGHDWAARYITIETQRAWENDGTVPRGAGMPAV